MQFIFNKKLLFDKRFFDHLKDYSKISNRKHKLIIFILNRILFVKIIILCESIFATVINFKIPIYSLIVKYLVDNLEGIPSFIGCYFRSLYYSKKLYKIEPNVIIEKGVFFRHPKGVTLSEFAYIDKSVNIMSKETFIGRRVHLAPFVFITGGGSFEIHDYAGMASGVTAITSTESLKNQTRPSGPMVPFHQRDLVKGKVIIKKDAFISTGVTILTNTVIEEGTVISANLVCPVKTEPWSVYANVDSSSRLVRAKRLKGRKPLDLCDY